MAPKKKTAKKSSAKKAVQKAVKRSADKKESKKATSSRMPARGKAVRKVSKAVRTRVRVRVAPLGFDQVKQLVQQNKKSLAFTDECVIAICWKESSFDPSQASSTSSAKGLMQMTDPAIVDVNNNTPQGIHFEPSDMFDPAKAIQCGTFYLQLKSDQAGGDERQALNNYGGVPNYADNVMQAENCLLTGVDAPMDCLKKIHSFQAQRRTEHLIDDPTGASRFKRVPQ
jgi:hypothetical protein